MINKFSFCSFLAPFHGFLCFLAVFFKFCQVVQSYSHSAKTATNVFLNFIVLLCPFFFCFSICFFSFIFTLFFSCIIYYLYTKTTLNVVTLVSHSQETGDKKTACIVVF